MKEGRNGNIKADEVKRAYFSANPPETNEAHDLEEDELEANSSMVRRQTLASRYGATNIEEVGKLPHCHFLRLRPKCFTPEMLQEWTPRGSRMTRSSRGLVNANECRADRLFYCGHRFRSKPFKSRGSIPILFIQINRTRMKERP